MHTIVRQFCKWSNWVHKKLPHLIYFALATNYFNVFMSTTVLLGLTSFEKNWGPVDFWGSSDFSNLLAPWASGSRSLMLRAAFPLQILLYPCLRHSFNNYCVDSGPQAFQFSSYWAVFQFLPTWRSVWDSRSSHYFLQVFSRVCHIQKVYRVHVPHASDLCHVTGFTAIVTSTFKIVLTHTWISNHFLVQNFTSARRRRAFPLVQRKPFFIHDWGIPSKSTALILAHKLFQFSSYWAVFQFLPTWRSVWDSRSSHYFLQVMFDRIFSFFVIYEDVVIKCVYFVLLCLVVGLDCRLSISSWCDQLFV